MGEINKINYSKPVKESYSSDIRDSRDEELKDLLYEFIDDYTYEKSSHVLVHLKTYKDKTYVYFSMENGPKDSDTLNKLVTWKVSGSNGKSEDGHQGGGNCRFIYGHYTDKVILHSMIESDKFIRLETNPDKILEVSKSEMSEGDFSRVVDRDCVKWSTETLDYEEEGSWFRNYRDEIQQEKGLQINYIIRFNLTNINKEYIDKSSWEYLKIRMKNYKIPLYFKNELLGETEFTQNIQLDFIGHGDNRVEGSAQTLELFIDGSGDYYIKKGDETRDSNNQLKSGENMKKYATLHCHQINKIYLSNQLKQINQISKEMRKYTNENFYGPWIHMNDKTTNYLPVPGIFQPSKQFAGGGNSQFRMTIIPEGNNDELNKFIVTYTIKAKTTFRDINKTKNIMKIAQNMYAEIPVTIKGHRVKSSPKKKQYNAPIVEGGVYLVYLSMGLWKFGMVETYDRLEGRIKEHRDDSINSVKEFCEIDIIEKNCIVYYKVKIENAKLLEEKINIHLKNLNEDKIIMFDKATGNDIREYFKCNDHDYIIQTLIPVIKNLRE